jgi:hemerythrin superfamily protein
MALPGETEQGKALFQELLWVHGAIRRDLETVRTLAGEVGDGLPAADARARIEALKTDGPLWQLKVNCLRYCRFVHMHHNAEDTLFFPRLREADPEVGPVIDKLEADHRVVSELLDRIEASAAAMERERLVEALESLAGELLAHLDFEEEAAGPTIRSLERHPFA